MTTWLHTTLLDPHYGLSVLHLHLSTVFRNMSFKWRPVHDVALSIHDVFCLLLLLLLSFFFFFLDVVFLFKLLFLIIKWPKWRMHLNFLHFTLSRKLLLTLSFSKNSFVWFRDSVILLRPVPFISKVSVVVYLLFSGSRNVALLCGVGSLLGVQSRDFLHFIHCCKSTVAFLSQVWYKYPVCTQHRWW